MSSKTYFLSWGGGVNSTAMVAMIKLGMLPMLTKDNTHIVFADTGAEMPYTYAHTNLCLSPMACEGWQVKVLRPWVDKEFYSPRQAETQGLPDYCLKHKVIPNRMPRWCSVEYKAMPIRKYRKALCGEDWKKNSVMILGIANDEQKRAKELSREETMYPLIDQSIDRQGCLDLSERAGLPIPRKSGCYLCPFQGKAQWLELYAKYPDLFKEAEEVERNARERYDGDDYYLYAKIPIRQQIEKWHKKIKSECEQGLLFDEHRNCLCEL